MEYAQQLDWLRSSVGVLTLDDRAILSLSGDDAHEWLQGQLTNQCDGATPGDAVYGFILSLRGRILADVWALFHDEGIWLDVPNSEVEGLLERLDRYIIMEDVDVEHRTDLRVLVAQGPRAIEIRSGGWRTDRLKGGGREWLIPEADLKSELAWATTRARELGGGPIEASAWGDAHVLEGRPRFGVDFGTWTYPQETGLTPLAVSFNKGCYVGQETVVMLENRGKAPKTLWRWTLEADEPPRPRAPIDQGRDRVGEITSAVQAGASIRALGFLKRGRERDLDNLEVDGLPLRPIGPVLDAFSRGPMARDDTEPS